MCGGFAVPLRQEYADVVYIVTSGEFMSIYAANNILRGVKNYDVTKVRVGGIIFNHRGIEDEEGRVNRFARAAGLPVCISFPRNDLFFQAEQMGQTIVEAFGGSSLARRFVLLARRIMDQKDYFKARPLPDDELEGIVLGHKKTCRFLQQEYPSPEKVQTFTGINEKGPAPVKRFFSKSVQLREPLHGCAFAGAVNITTQIKDSFTVAHGPRSCAHIASQTILSTARRTLATYGMILPDQLSPPLMSSNMSEGLVIFGGMEELEKQIRTLAASNPKVIFIATTCPAGIIGDDIQGVIERTRDLQKRVKIIPITTDGNIAGDFLQGVINASLEGAAALIDETIRPREDMVNIVAEKTVAANTEMNFAVVKELLKSLGLRVNCRFVCRTSVEELGGFLKGKVNLLAHADLLGRVLRDFLVNQFGVAFTQHPFPVGFNETVRWLEEIGTLFGRLDRARAIIEQHRESYWDGITRLRPSLEGRRLMMVTYNHAIDWIIDTALDVGMEIVKVGILNYCHDNQFRTRYGSKFPVETGYSPERRTGDIYDLKPDLVLSNYTPVGLPDLAHYDTIPLCPDVGFNSGLALAERWHRIIKLPTVEGWKRDGALYKQHLT